MTSGDQETVFAVASGSGRAAVTLLRISGPLSGAVLERLCRGKPPPRRASLRTLRDCCDQALDSALVLWLPGPGSYTGEDCVELHLHGGRAVLSDVAATLVGLGLRPAEPGEFTRRAFMNGQLDLVEAEAIADLIDAETSAQRRQALRQLEGALGSILSDWANRLKVLLAQQEALIDFPDEDLPDEVEDKLIGELAQIGDAILLQLSDNRRGERLREGLVFAVVGAPNAGKSSLINSLTQREVAIVSPYPGTTRDVLEARVELGGVPITLLDTAGLRETTDPIEAEGVRRGRRRAAEADLVIVVSSASEPYEEDVPETLLCVRVTTKIDLYGDPVDGTLGVCTLNGEGLDQLITALASHARDLTDAEGPPPLTRARHRAALIEAAARIKAAQSAPAPELRAEDMRLALRAIGRVTGHVGVEDILDSIFLQFCIGK